MDELWLKQDDATCHTADETIDLLKENFGEPFVTWPLRFCDSKPLELFRWDYMMSLV